MRSSRVLRKSATSRAQTKPDLSSSRIVLTNLRDNIRSLGGQRVENGTVPEIRENSPFIATACHIMDYVDWIRGCETARRNIYFGFTGDKLFQPE
jgi:hypothetical protein